MDITDKESYRSLYSELKQYEKRGIDILMDGYQVSPMQIVTAYMAKEEGAYICDGSEWKTGISDIYRCR